MKRFVVTRSLATATVAAGWALLLALTVMVPLSSIRVATVGFVALIVGGMSILLRERVLVPVTASHR
jgi:hypothetical protein